MANAFRDTKKHKDPFSIEDFMFSKVNKKQKKTQSVDDAKAAIKAIHETVMAINAQKGGGK